MAKNWHPYKPAMRDVFFKLGEYGKIVYVSELDGYKFVFQMVGKGGSGSSGKRRCNMEDTC